MKLKQLLRKLRPRWFHDPAGDMKAYLRNGRRPWSRGYLQFRDQFLAQRLRDPSFLQTFQASEPLPPGYGAFLDERVVEYPWLFSRLPPQPSRILDAGSILNYPHLLEHARLQNKRLTIVTLAPEGYCLWQKAISYVFADLRDLPFRDAYFDCVVCISTLEHVGKDNATYTDDPAYRENHAHDFEKAVRELRRVCRTGGQVLLTVPFGRFTDFGWYQQFDARLIDRVIGAFAPARYEETYFRYRNGGWNVSDREGCAQCEGFDIHATKHRNPRSTRDYDPDFAAASRGIAALVLYKGA